MIAKRRSFSLIEIAIAMLLISLTLSLCLRGVYKGWKEESYRCTAKQLAEKLSLCRQVAFYDRQNITLTLMHEDHHIACSALLGKEKDLNPQLEKTLCRPLKEVESMAFQNSEERQFTLNFSPSLGTQMPCVITLFFKNHPPISIVLSKTIEVVPGIIYLNSEKAHSPPYPQEAYEET